MKKKNYLAPDIDTLDIELQSLIAGSSDHKSVGFSSTPINDESQVGGDNDGGLFGTLE